MENDPKHRILIVDDEDAIRRMIAQLLSREGYECFQAQSVETAWETLQQTNCSLMVLDIMMPGGSGMQLLEKVKAGCPDLAVIMVTAVDDRTTAMRALELGAYGYVIKPFETNELVISVANALERRRLVMASRRYEQDLEQKVAERTAEVRATQEEITLRLLAAAEHRDEETGAHIKRMGLYAWQIAQQLGWKGRDLEDIRLAAPMHDIGKLGIPDAILRKPGKLTAEEFEIMKRHTVIGAQILSGEEAPLLRMARDIALWHHEKWDGSGYLHALVGDATPLSARIVAVADVYDAMTHDRIYRPAVPEAQTLAVMREGRGKHFDPDVFDAFLEILPQFRKIAEEVGEQS